jgi:hypothetical protein
MPSFLKKLGRTYSVCSSALNTCAYTIEDKCMAERQVEREPSAPYDKLLRAGETPAFECERPLPALRHTARQPRMRKAPETNLSRQLRENPRQAFLINPAGCAPGIKKERGFSPCSCALSKPLRMCFLLTSSSAALPRCLMRMIPNNVCVDSV